MIPLREFDLSLKLNFLFLHLLSQLLYLGFISTFDLSFHISKLILCV